MKRKEFIKTCCFAGAGLALGSTLLSSCTPMHYVSSTIQNKQIKIKLSEFLIQDKEGNTTKDRTYIVVDVPALGFPICLTNKEDYYRAILMECTHQSCEVNIGGGLFTCPCHGSEFSMKGELMTGPAKTNLKSYKTESDNEHVIIYIS